MDKDINYFKKLNYNAIIKQRGKLFVVFIPELSLIEEDESLDKAYEKLEIKKEKYFQKMIKLGCQDEIMEPSGVRIKKSFVVRLAPNLALFLIKLMVILMVGSIGIKVATRAISMQQIFDQARKVVLAVNSKINNMSEEKKEKRRTEIREMVKNIKPFVDEFKVLSKDESDEKK